MSLINEALKRTQGAQQQNPPPAGGPAFRPAEPVAHKDGSGARTLLFIMVFAVVVGNILLWIAVSDRNAKKTVATESPTVAAEIASTAAASSPSAVPVTSAVVPQTPPAAPAAAPEVPVVAIAVEDIIPAAVVTNAPETAPAVVFAEPAKPAVLRLQSIIYGSRPSAMIGGKFLFVGDRIQGHQVIAIDKETVTLVGDGQTNTLSLP